MKYTGEIEVTLLIKTDVEADDEVGAVAALHEFVFMLEDVEGVEIDNAQVLELSSSVLDDEYEYTPFG